MNTSIALVHPRLLVSFSPVDTLTLCVRERNHPHMTPLHVHEYTRAEV